MQTILIAGAGKSSVHLIEYFGKTAPQNDQTVIVADGDPTAVKTRTEHFPHLQGVVLDINDGLQRSSLVEKADIVLSLMPPDLHVLLARDCLKYKKNLITSSYISDQIKALDDKARAAGLTFMCEMGLDPGIDHMSANKMIHEIGRQGGVLKSFRSYCGGLIAPESDDNPWHYKFTWNPRNIITAGSDGAVYRLAGAEKHVGYHEMYDHCSVVEVNGLGSLAWYPNRDSLKYLSLYELDHADTFLRATFRYPEFCEGWNALIKLGLTDNSDAIGATGKGYAQWVAEKTSCQPGTPLLEHVAGLLGEVPDSRVMKMLVWLGLFDNQPIPGGTQASSGGILLNLLLDKWAMQPGDRDMVVMLHEIEYQLGASHNKLTSTMILKGDDRSHSAMSKTVGLPMAMLAELMLKGQLVPPAGVLIPNMPEVYLPVLKRLEDFGIRFTDKVELQ